MREKLRVVFAVMLLALGIVGMFLGFYRMMYGIPITRGVLYRPFLDDLIVVLLVGGGLSIFVAGLASFKRWGWYSSEALIATVLSVVLTLSLIHVTHPLPGEISGLLRSVNLDWALLRTLGYASFAAMLILIFAGFLAKKGKMSIFGSVALCLPVFGCYSSSMVLFSMSFLALPWLPIWELCPQIISLGNIVLLPQLSYNLIYLVNLPFWWPYVIYTTLLSVMITLGIAAFLIGTMTWFCGKFKGFDLIDFGIYRYSRHPQYLGFLLWSYGLLLMITSVPPVDPPSSLVWLISALIIIGVALHEETLMVKRHGDKYVAYRNNTPFMLPLPKQIATLIKAPVKVLLKKDLPQNGKEVACIIMIYGLALVLLSAITLFYGISFRVHAF